MEAPAEGTRLGAFASALGGPSVEGPACALLKEGKWGAGRVAGGGGWGVTPEGVMGRGLVIGKA